jgi:dihydromonapterin reductase/dihydrofolate reductase
MTEYILLTGANKRVGHDLAAHLQSRGYQVIGVVRTAPLTPLDGVDYVHADLTCPAQVDALIACIRQKAPSLRAIIHNASVWLEDTASNIDQMLTLHVSTPIRINLALQDLISAAPRCDIINICDDAASRGSRNHIGYAAAKAALLNTTLSFARLFPPSVRVNAISPGLLYLKEGSDTAYQARAISKAKIQREPGADPIINTLDYIMASDFMTGSNIVVNGGRHIK